MTSSCTQSAVSMSTVAAYRVRRNWCHSFLGDKHLTLGHCADREEPHLGRSRRNLFNQLTFGSAVNLQCSKAGNDYATGCGGKARTLLKLHSPTRMIEACEMANYNNMRSCGSDFFCWRTHLLAYCSTLEAFTSS